MPRKIASRVVRIRRIRKGFLASGNTSEGIARTSRLFAGTDVEKDAGPGPGKKKKRAIR